MSMTPIRSPQAPSSPSPFSGAPPPIDFGSPEALSQIRAITDVGTLNRLLHECIAFQRSLDVSLESLLSRKPDLDRQLTALLRSSPPLLDLAVSEASNLLNSSESSASLASSLSSHVRHLDLAQSRVDSTLSRVQASLERSRALESARRALASESPDLESAARAVNAFLQIDLNFPSEEDDLRRDMLDLKKRLETLIRRHLTTAIDSRNHPSVLSLIRLFPLLSLSKEGLQTFVSYLKKVVSLRARLDFEHLAELADSSGRPDFVGCLTSLFKDIVLAIEENDGVLRELSGDEGVGYAVLELQEECDSRGTQVLKKYSEFRKLTRLANEINSYSKSNLLSVTTVIANQQPGPDPREVETYLEEILTLTQLGEDYAEFMISKIRGLGNSEIGSKGIKAVKFGSFSKMVQDLTGFYVIFEEFFMVENVRKAIKIDELVSDAVTTSMVDDVFFVLQSCCRRAISTGSITSMLAVLAGATSLLSNEYQDAIQQRMREPNLSAKLFLGGVGVQKTGTEVATALNNIDVSSDYVQKLRHEIEDLCAEAFPSQTDRERVKSCLSELTEISNTFKKILNSGLDQLLQSISPRIRPVLDSVATVSYDLTDSDYAENESNDPWSQKLIFSISTNLSWLQPYLTTNNYDSLVHLVIDFVVKRLEVIMMQKRFNQLGGLQLDKEVRGLINHFSEMTQRPVRDKFSRLSQVATILNFERVSEILDFWGDNAGHLTWMLTPAEVRRVLGLRVDFRPEAIAALRL